MKVTDNIWFPFGFFISACCMWCGSWGYLSQLHDASKCWSNALGLCFLLLSIYIWPGGDYQLFTIQVEIQHAVCQFYPLCYRLERVLQRTADLELSFSGILSSYQDVWPVAENYFLDLITEKYFDMRKMSVLFSRFFNQSWSSLIKFIIRFSV
jgi:hypothetical protein